MTAIARLEGVTHRYGEQVALDGVSLDLPAHCLAGVIGPDGVGKSTLLGLVAGVRRPQLGCIEVLGQSLARHRDLGLARRIAYMPQGLGSNLYPTLSIEENLEFFGRLYSLPKAERLSRMADLLEATGLAAFRQRPAGKLSGGMKQKLGLCCALIHDPELLILDEPTTGVDPLSRRQFWALIDNLRASRAGLSVLVASAYMEEASRFDWLAMMHSGQVIARGSPAELLQRTGADNLDRAFVELLPADERHTASAETSPPGPRALTGVHEDAVLAIEARNLSRRFGDFVAVDRVNFEIRRGEIFGFLGSNGCGKTTTMKILTGLLPASEGEAFLLGQPVDARDPALRHRIGYMSQSFSLYEELTVLQNLQLHGRIYALRGDTLKQRIDELLQEMDLGAVLNRPAGSLPLGQRQRLSLAVAVIHQPELLILDEPTSGVDPVARDQFWALLVRLARQQQVTIFISTHYLNEAHRCDRISLMHAGQVLAQGAPDELVTREQAADLEDAFVAVLARAQGESAEARSSAPAPADNANIQVPLFDLRRLLAYASREWRELWREPLRLVFALVGPVFLLLVLGYGINFDVEDLSFAAFDQDRSPVSRELLAAFDASRYFEQHAALSDSSELFRRLAAGNINFALEIPPEMGQRIAQGQPAEFAVWIDGSMPFRAERTRAYVLGAQQVWLSESDAALGQAVPPPPYDLETRFRYNPNLQSINAIGPGMVAVLMTLIPAMLMAVAVVREKELGSITNFYTTPTHRLEFLWGKQLPYIAVAAVSFACLMLVTRLVFGIELKGSPWVLWSGGLFYGVVASSLGLLISCFTRTQIAALFAALIITIIPAINFSGLLKPTASLEGGALVLGTVFPTSYLLNITVGTLTKGVGWAELWPNFAALIAFFLGFTAASALLLGKEAK